MIKLSRSGGLTVGRRDAPVDGDHRARQDGARVITGRVTSDAGVPLPGANVLIQELNVSVGTTADGRFTIAIPAARVSGSVGSASDAVGRLHAGWPGPS
jgi:hypothetical protein